MTGEWSHKQLVRRMADWLKYTKQMKAVVTDLRTASPETPDVIAWNSSGLILIECKVSRADFLKDKKKWFRRGDCGVGDIRYMAAPRGLLKPDEMPDGWGLLEVESRGERQCTRVTKKPPDVIPWEVNKRNEVKMLVSVIRRLEISTAVYVVAETPEGEEGVGMDKPWWDIRGWDDDDWECFMQGFYRGCGYMILPSLIALAWCVWLMVKGA